MNQKNQPPSSISNILSSYPTNISQKDQSYDTYIPPFNTIPFQLYNHCSHSQYPFTNLTNHSLFNNYPNQPSHNLFMPHFNNNNPQDHHPYNNHNGYPYNYTHNDYYISSAASQANHEYSLQCLGKKKNREHPKSNNNSPQSTDIDNNNNSKPRLTAFDYDFIMNNNKNKKEKDIEDDEGLRNEGVDDEDEYKKSPRKEVGLSKNSNGSVSRKRNNHQPTELERYKDEEYTNDLQRIINSHTKHKFMYENFPSAYTKGEVLFNIIKLNKKRSERKIFIEANDLRDDNTFIVNPFLCELSLKEIPKVLWAPIDNISDNEYNIFYKKLDQQWPFESCPFVYDYILEFFMMNNYSQDNCFKNFNKCVMFVKEKIAQQITDDNENCKKKEIQITKEYNLRYRKGAKS